jgi:hypothetical protein
VSDACALIVGSSGLHFSGFSVVILAWVRKFFRRGFVMFFVSFVLSFLSFVCTVNIAMLLSVCLRC